jgi:2-iminobutanoate/2-iminopropanoate deaminase
MKPFLPLALLLLGTAAGTRAQTPVEAVKTTNAPAAIGPYSQAVWAGPTLYVSGQLGLAGGGLVSGGTDAEARRALQNTGAILKAAGLDFGRVVKVTIYLTDLADFERVNAIYKTFVREPYPARETVQVAALPRGARVEISCVAVK